jgi:hypothetical protein
VDAPSLGGGGQYLSAHGAGALSFVKYQV